MHGSSPIRYFRRWVRFQSRCCILAARSSRLPKILCHSLTDARLPLTPPAIGNFLKQPLIHIDACRVQDFQGLHRGLWRGSGRLRPLPRALCTCLEIQQVSCIYCFRPAVCCRLPDQRARGVHPVHDQIAHRYCRLPDAIWGSAQLHATTAAICATDRWCASRMHHLGRPGADDTPLLRAEGQNSFSQLSRSA